MTFRLSIATLGLAAWLTSTLSAADVEVLARGPVHEAYAEPSEREPAPTPVIPKEPPKLIEELPPDQKPEGENVQWMPGYWAWDEEKKDHIWISGFWRNAPPGRSWVPGSWRKTTDGWQWSGGFWAGAKEDKADINYLPQPPAPLDNTGPATPAPSDNHTYVPGSWVWRDRYVWRPGFWSEHRPGWVWISAHYRWTPAGYVFIDGYWDYPLQERGILFAPAYIPPAVYAAPSYVYTPTVIVREDCLYGAFFARRGYGCYYFGDYFHSSYASLGFVAWSGHVSASLTIGGWCDPLFSYYRCGYRTDPYWGGGGIHALYVGRYRGDYLCPPRTLVQQNVVINNITNNNTVTNVNTNNVTMLSNLNDATRGGRRNLQQVSEVDRRAQQQAARSVREVADRRATLENQLAATPRTAGQAASARALTLDVPKRPVAAKPSVSPKGSELGGTGAPVSKSPPSIGSTSPPAPKATALGKVDPPKVGAGNSPVLPKSPPVTPKLPTTTRSADPPATKPLPKSSGPALDPPATKTPISPPTPKSVSPPVTVPKSPTLPPAPKPSVSPPVTVPKSPTLPPALKPSVSPPVTLPPTPKSATLPPVAPRATPVVPSVPRSAPAPAPARPSIPKATPVVPSVPRSAPVRPSVPAPKPVTPARPAPRPAAAMPSPSYKPAPIVNRGVAPSVAPRSYSPPVSRPAPAMSRPAPAMSRPAPAISRPAPSIRAPVKAPARPAAPKKGKR